MKSKHSVYALGLMSGTSLDGLDIAYVKFNLENQKISSFELMETEAVSYAKELEEKLRNAHLLSAKDLLSLDVAYGKWLGEKIKAFKNKYCIDKIDVVGSHGHTVYHQPEHGFTLQIGHGAHISAVSGETVISDFRSQDIALGGQGAPLVPIGDKILFSKYDACLNLGGFANLSFDNEENERVAFDICPVNYVLNALTKRLNLPYDDKGKIAKENKVHLPLLDELNLLNFYNQTGPKSLGREWVENEVFPLLNQYNLSAEDLISTYTQHAAIQLANTFNKYNLKDILATGGGAYNVFLLKEVEYLSNVKFKLPQPKLIEYKEAIIFALLATLKIENQENILASVTGAKKNLSSGVIYHANS